jgi:catechol 2,3-dioxygenase-like lactoylglutathione lyase family enzyme
VRRDYCNPAGRRDPLYVTQRSRCCEHLPFILPAGLRTAPAAAFVAFRCADGTDFGVFVSQGRPSGTHTQVTFFCQSVDAEVADLRARGVQLEEFDLPGATLKDGVYDMNGQRGAWFRDPEGNLLAVAERPEDSVS